MVAGLPEQRGVGRRPVTTPTPAPCADLELAAFSSGLTRVAGVDEVGRGSWAGPVVAAAVIFSPATLTNGILAGVRDSKCLTPHVRQEVARTIHGVALAVGIGAASAHLVDTLGLTRATALAMRRAVLRLRLAADHLLIDGLPIKGIETPHTCIVDGDALCLSIAAASIVAKVARDSWMVHWDTCYPAYAFGRNKGYGTAAHRHALADQGPCPLHRRSFGPVASLPATLDAPT